MARITVPDTTKIKVEQPEVRAKITVPDTGLTPLFAAPRRILEEASPEKKGIWGKLVGGIAAPIRAIPRFIGQAAQSVGHISVGDIESAQDLPSILDTVKQAYNDSSGSLKIEILRGLHAASVATAQGFYQNIGTTLPQAIAYLTEGDLKGVNQALQSMDAPLREGKGIAQLTSEQLNEFYPQFGPGVSYIVYQDGKQTFTSKVSNDKVVEFTNKLSADGKRVVDIFVQEPEKIAFLKPDIAFNLNDVTAFATEVADPFLAGLFGKGVGAGIRATAKGTQYLKAIPGAKKAIDAVGNTANRVAGPGTTVGKFIDNIENSEFTGLTLTKTTKGYRFQLYPYTLGARAARSQIGEQAETVTQILRGQSKEAAKVARLFLDKGRSAAKREDAALWMINHGLVGESGVDDAARTILRIHELPQADKVKLEKLTHDMATGDTINDSILVRVEQAIARGEPVPEVSKDVERAYRTIRGLAKREAELGLEPGDVRVLSNAIRLPRGGMGVASDELQKVFMDFNDILRGNKKTISKYKMADDEISELLTNGGPEWSSLGLEPNKQLSAGFKAIHTAEGMGISSASARRMRDALRVASATKWSGKVDRLVDRYVEAETVILQELVAGPKVAKKARDFAQRVRKAVIEEAEATGIDPDTVRRAAKVVRETDEAWGKLEVEAGIISEAQFEGMRGIHVRRILNFDDMERRIVEIEAKDPDKAARMMTEYEELKATSVALKQANFHPGGIGTSIARQRQNLTVEFRQLMDEVNNASDAILISGRKAATDISQAQLYNSIRHSGLAADGYLPGFELLEGASWGALDGKWVPRPVKTDLVRIARELHTRPEAMLSTWTKYVVRPFKLSSVVFYPPARMHNAMSNAVAVQYATGVTDVPLLLNQGRKAITSMLKRDKYFHRYAKYSPSVRESSLLLHEQFSDLLRASNNELLEKTAIGRAYRYVGKTMSWEESTAKMTIFHTGIMPKHLGGLGLSDAEAVLLAEKFMIDYGQVPAIVDILRRKTGLAPFMTYAYKMSGNLAKTLIKKPEVVARQFKLYEAMTEMVDPGVREREKVGIPDWLKNNLVIRLPGKEARYFNLDPYIPWNIFDLEGKEDLAMPTPLRAIFNNMGQPYKGIIDIATNVNTFSGAPIVPRGTDPETAAKLRFDYLSRQIGPVRLLSKLNKSAWGAPISPKGKPQAAWEVIFDVRNLDINREAEVRYKQKINQASKAVALAKKTLESKNITPEVKEERFTKLMNFSDKLKREALTIGEEVLRINGIEPMAIDSGATAEDARRIALFLNEQAIASPELRRTAEEAGKIYRDPDGNAFSLEALNQVYAEQQALLQEVVQGVRDISIGGTPVAAQGAQGVTPRPQDELAQTANEALVTGATPVTRSNTREVLPGLPPQR